MHELLKQVCLLAEGTLSLR